MTFVQCKCTNCGANLQVDAAKDAAICSFCGTPFVLEKAINYYNSTNQIAANVVNIYGDNSVDFVIRGGTLERYNGESTEVWIPEKVKIVGKRAFFNCAIEKVYIPNSVVEIDIEAFAQCNYLTSVTVPESVKVIHDNAFSSCVRLTSIVIPDGTNVSQSAFSFCESLQIHASEAWKKKFWMVHPSLENYSSKHELEPSYKLVLLSGCASIKQIKAIREVALFDLSKTMSLFSSLPYTLADNMPLRSAEEMGQKLSAVGLSVEISKDVSS